MSTHLRTFVGKVFLLSTTLGIIFSVGTHYYTNGFFNLSKVTTQNTSNEAQFKKTNSSDLGSISVAITTNIGTSHKLLNELPATIYKDVMSFQEAVHDRKKASDEIIGKNMIVVEEYRNVLKTSIKNLINNSLDKKDTLEAYISQLEYRFENAVENQKNLIRQKEIFTASMQEANEKVNVLRGKIQTDFNAQDSQASLENIDKFLEAKQQYYFARTYIVYINQFLREYQYLNAYNKNLLDVLINNKQAIIKDAYVIVPNNGGVEALKALDLLFDEADFKNQ